MELNLPLLRYWYTLQRISEPTPLDVSFPLIIPLQLKVTSFQKRDSKRIASIYFEESQIIFSLIKIVDFYLIVKYDNFIFLLLFTFRQ